ncbi:hypothetical protein OS493_022429 [Desmophyllum pertusum]|uniref:Uncharacterized protein n=1 Tax=Desmophyllum pertusum TaxID=174260 RepID=A0A9W9ZMC0_9CNID|nr:hypothetical protein OS493_022429 [Desmophyllum pertusum]
MGFDGSVRGIFVFLALFCTTTYGDYVAHSDTKGNNNEATGFTILIVLGVVFAIQLIVFVLFACRGWDAVFGSSRSVRADRESQWANQLPFLPSYEMVMNEVRASQQSINTTPENASIDNGVILEIRSSGPSIENQSNATETNASVNTPRRSNSLDDGVVLEIRSYSVNASLQESISSIDEQTDNDASDLDNTEDDNEAVSFTVLVILGVVFTIQLIVFILFACKGWDAVFGSQSVCADPDAQWANQLPFLPSYEIAMNEVQANQQDINTTTENASIDNGVILEIRSSGVTPWTENQSSTIETNA